MLDCSKFSNVQLTANCPEVLTCLQIYLENNYKKKKARQRLPLERRLGFGRVLRVAAAWAEAAARGGGQPFPEILPRGEAALP